MIAVRADSPYKTLKDLMDKKILTASYLVRRVYWQPDWMKTALLAKAIDIDPRKCVMWPLKAAVKP